MKSLVEYVKECEGIAPSMGDEMSSSNFMTPGNTMGMGNPKPPTPEAPGSDEIMGIGRKMKPTFAKKKKKMKSLKECLEEALHKES